MVKWLPVLKTIVVLVLLGVLTKIVIDSRHSFTTGQWHFETFGLALLVGLTLFPTSIASWYLVLYSLGIRLRVVRAAQIWLYANVARLIPGVVWQYGTRVVLGHQLANIPKFTIVMSMFYEMLLLLVTAVLVIVTVLPWWPTLSVSPWIGLVALIGALIIVSRPATAIIAKVTSRLLRRTVTIKNIGPGYAFGVVAINATHFLLNGLTLTLLLGALGEPLHWWYPMLLSGAYAFSWAVGYLTFIAPGGIGVADITLAGILSTIIAPPLAALVALTMRLVLILSELCNVGLVSILKR